MKHYNTTTPEFKAFYERVAAYRRGKRSQWLNRPPQKSQIQMCKDLFF